MCGLAGYYSFSSHRSVEPLYLEKMQQALQHRGPDGYRCWTNKTQTVGFTHRRLSILDLSEAGFQPMFSADQSIVVMCNGEIYNHPQLRQELEALGYQYSSDSDTETIVYAYQQWGIECLHKFNGMFAIVIYDQRTHELYLVRDRMGIKPVYFSLQDHLLSFASEIKALWQLPWLTKTINKQALSHYLTYMVTPAPYTLYDGVYKLPAGFYMHITSAGNYSFTQWYDPLHYINPTLATLSEQEHIENIRTLLRDSVKQQMLSDVPYGVFLSGGIDSSLNVALMSEFTSQVKTFNVSFSDGPEYSEQQWARTVAQRFATDHHEIVIDEKDAFIFYESMLYHLDEPLADCVCVPLYYVSKLLKDSGVTVVQVGEGSDELFCGYSTYAKTIDFYNRYWRPANAYIPALAKKTLYQVARTLFADKVRHRELLKNWAEDKALFWSGAIAVPESMKGDIVAGVPEGYDAIVHAMFGGLMQQHESHDIARFYLDRLKNILPQADFLTSMIYLELKQRLPELLLMRVDKMAMATAVEGRVPFLDHRIVEYSLSMPSEYKYRNGITKYILKKAAEGILPHDVIYRPKMGFAAPTKRWFKQGHYFKPYFADLLHSKRTALQEYCNVDAIANIFNKNQEQHYDYSVQLWTLQQLMTIV